MTISSVICINKHVLNFANVALLCVAKSLATLGYMHILAYNIFVHQSGGWVARAERVGFAGKNLHKISVLKFIYFFKMFSKVTLLIYIVTCLRGFAIRFFIIAAFIIVAAFIFRNPFGMSWACYMRTQCYPLCRR